MMSDIDKVFENMTTAPLLFIGSGFTKRYCGTMSWAELMEKLAQKIRSNSHYPLPSYRHEVGENIPDHKLFPKIASLMENEFNRKFFSGEEIFSVTELDRKKIEEGISPFRIYLAQLFSDVKKQKLEDSLQQELSDLKVASKHSVNGIITTNYDKFLEQIFPDYDVYIGQTDLIFSEATGYLEIYKIHGCCSDPQSLVFTEENYEEFERKKSYLTSKLLSFFMEHPILFLGYSASDANIQGIFSSIVECLNEYHLSMLAQRIVFVEYNLEQHTPIVTPYAFNFENKQLVLTKISTSSYLPIFKSLIKVKRNYNLNLLKRIKQDLYKTVHDNSPQDIIQVISSELLDEEGKIAPRHIMGFTNGYFSGHNVLKSEDVYRHIIMMDCKIEINSFMESWLPEHMSRFEYPIFYFITEYLKNHSCLPRDGRIQDYINKHTYFESFLSSALRKKKERRPYNSLKEIEEKWDSIKNKYQKIAFLDEKELAHGRLFQFLRNLLVKDPTILHSGAQYITDLKRLIRICDWLENKDAVLRKERRTA